MGDGRRYGRKSYVDTEKEHECNDVNQVFKDGKVSWSCNSRVCNDRHVIRQFGGIRWEL